MLICNPKMNNYKWSRICPSLTASCYKEPPCVLVSPKLINTHPKSSDIDTQTSKTMEISRKSTGVQYPTLTCSSVEVLAKIYQSLESVKDLKESGQDSLPSISAPLKKKSLSISSGKMLREFCHRTKALISQGCKIKWPKQGMACGGKYLTPKTSVYPKTESVCLSSVLEMGVPEKYYLSERAMKSVLGRMDKGTRIVSKHRGTYVALTEKRTEEAKRIRRETKDRDFSPRRGKYLVTRKDNIGNCVTSGQSKESLLSDGARIRRLTPLECERLMSWTDDWTKYGTNEKGEKVEMSDSSRYKMCGNGVVSNVVRELVNIFI